MDHNERKFMETAIEESKKCVPEDERPHPKVGVVVVRENDVLITAFRGELNPGEHAEYTALERKLRDRVLAGATVYTTLEPCTARNHPKIPCAKRLIERKIERIVIGMVDPNPEFQEKAIGLLRDANIAVDFFRPDLMAVVEELNRDFRRRFQQPLVRRAADKQFIDLHHDRPLDDWYRTLKVIYFGRNFYRDPNSLFAHLVEVVGALGLLVSEKLKPGFDPQGCVPKAIAWWLALCGKMGVMSVSDMIWAKFPHVCPYCSQPTHDAVECRKRRAERPSPDWEGLARMGEHSAKPRPKSLGEWQRMFAAIYPPGQTEGYAPTFARLTEELGEIAEALRVFPVSPGYFLSEAADAFAWLMHVQNIMDLRRQPQPTELGRSLEDSLCAAYPDRCIDCGGAVCSCPPIPEWTVGRTAHAMPVAKTSFSLGDLTTLDKALAAFRPTRNG